MKDLALYSLLILSTCLGSNAIAQEVDQKISKNPFSSNGISIFGKPVDNQTRCEHWHSALDIIAIKFKCCEKYYPCYSCHEETADHEAKVWPRNEFDTKAILCGVCGTELSIKDYMGCNNTCPKCASLFNPGCSKHYHLYFEVEGKSD
jgi:uncharacterized CHY-type Zn-finger protein